MLRGLSVQPLLKGLVLESHTSSAASTRACLTTAGKTLLPADLLVVSTIGSCLQRQHHAWYLRRGSAFQGLLMSCRGLAEPAKLRLKAPVSSTSSYAELHQGQLADGQGPFLHNKDHCCRKTGRW